MPTRGGSDHALIRGAQRPSLREEAARARRLAAGLTNAADNRLLTELADKLEAEAAELERGSG